MTKESRIKQATISYAQGMFDFDFLDGSARADLVFDDGSEDTFSWFHDEITFSEGDFLGRTMAEVRDIFLKRDTAWLRS